jgi:hypothetical protein
MSETRGHLIRAIANLRHLADLPGLDAGIVEGVEIVIRRLQSVLAMLDGDAKQIAALVDAATQGRDTLRGQLQAAEATLQRIMQILGPSTPASAECAGCATEIGLALAELRAYGITYRPRTPEGEGAAE